MPPPDRPLDEVVTEAVPADAFVGAPPREAAGAAAEQGAGPVVGE